MDATSSLAGLVVVGGRFHQRYVDRNGREELIPVPEIEHGPAGQTPSERFADTDTAPSPWIPGEHGAIERVSDELSINEIRARYARVEALLVKTFASSDSNGKGTFDTRGNGPLKQLLQDPCLIMGGEWAERMEDIR